MPDLTFGPARYYLPVSVRYPWGFHGGPVGYVEEPDENVGPITINQETIMSIEEIQRRVVRAGDSLDLARTEVAARSRALKTAEEEESRLNTHYLILIDERDAAVQASAAENL